MVKIGNIDINIVLNVIIPSYVKVREFRIDTSYYGSFEAQIQLRIKFDPSYPKMNQIILWACDQTDFYEGAVKLILPDAPLPQAKAVGLQLFVDINHADTKRNRRSRTGFMMYINI